MDYFSTNPDIDFEYIKTEEFSDLLESVLIRVTRTKSEEKHKRFRDVLVNKIQNPPVDIDNSEIYLDLITSLNEHEIRILYHHRSFDHKFDKEKETLGILRDKLIEKRELLGKEQEVRKNGFANNYDKVVKDITDLEREIQILRENQNSFQEYRRHTYYNLTEYQFLYYKQSLYAKGLLIDTGIGAIDTDPFEVMSITEFGKEFIFFIIKE